MLTTDLALRFDPIYEPISRRFLENPDQFADAFARAWFKLTHRDMGPIQRYLGAGGAAGDADLAGPDPGRSTRASVVDGRRRSPLLKAQILASGLSVSELVSAAWAAASSFRGSDKRGGANGGRIRLEPQSGWEVNDPDSARRRCCGRSRASSRRFNDASAGRRQGLPGRPRRARWLRRGRAGREGRGRRRSRSRSPRAGRTPRPSRPTRSPSRRSSRPPTGSATTWARATSCRPSTC